MKKLPVPKPISEHSSVWLRWCLILALISSFSQVSAQSCDIRVSADNGCVPTTIQFSLNTSGKTIDRAEWDFGDKNTSIKEGPTHTYDSVGDFEVKVKITFDDMTTCEKVFNKKIRIFDNPKASIDLEKSYRRCWEDRCIEFEENSTLGINNSPIDSYFWDMGNGDSFALNKFCYYYDTNRAYNVKLTVQDRNGCRNTVKQRIKVFVYPKLDVRYQKYAEDSCPRTIVRFFNRTDSNGWHVNKLEWDFGNGTKKISNKGSADWSNVWDTATAFYTGTKTFRPKLIVGNILGCSDTLKRYQIRNIFFPFSATATPPEQCFHDGNTNNPIVEFNHPNIDGANYIRWTFGDPSSSSNSSTGRWKIPHEYTEPGIFSIGLTIRVKACTRDTLFCDMVKILGPVAKINRYPGEYNDYEHGHEFYPNSFPDNFDSCNTDSVVYVTLDTTLVNGTRKHYCNAPKLDSVLVKDLSSCTSKDRYSYTLDPTSITNLTRKEITRTTSIWRKGDPVPTERPLFQVYEGRDLPANLHDTVIFSPNCGPPHRVQFINNTIKYRGKEALDNHPPGYQDSCLNPSFPWASDSLEYFWDFGEGQGDTSKDGSINELARYSTERLPNHLYTTKGCFTVKMQAFDPETGCSSKDSVYISVVNPDAKWDTVGFDTITRMTYRKQIQLKNEPFRRGMIIRGLECANYRQTLDLSETLPGCVRERFWIVWDSAEWTSVDTCNGKPVLNHNWVKSKKVENDFAYYNYTSTGWKTVGLIIEANDCFDTMWYHNYKYIYEAVGDFSASHEHACAGDTVTVKLIDTTQQGISKVRFEYSYRNHIDSAWVALYTDTLDYLKYKKGNSIRNYTSTMHNPDVKVFDDTTYNNLSQPSSFQVKRPGVYEILSVVSHRYGCDGTQETQIGVGHKASFKAQFRQVCVGDSFAFNDSIQYYQSFNLAPYNGLNPTNYWKDPTAARMGEQPRYPERIRWDFDSDGIIDAEGPDPKWSYSKPGVYTVTMYTNDSNNCGWMETKKSDFIRVVSAKARFQIENDDTLRFCAPHTFVFHDSTRIYRTNGKVKEKVQYWKWIWGDGEDIVKSRLENGKVTHQYLHNGEYEVLMRIQLETYASTKGAGCIDTFSRKIYIEGPEPRFELVGEDKGCQPFLATVRDLSENGISREWFTGFKGNTKQTDGQPLVKIGYPDPGTFYLKLNLSDSVIDLKGDTLFCTDSYPFEGDTIKVTVYPKDEIELSYPDPLCLNEEGVFEFEKTDSSYSEFRVHFGVGDTLTTTNRSMARTYKNVGNFPIFYTGSGARCPDTVQSSIDIIGIESNFQLDSNRLDTPAFWFNNLSEEGVRFDWIFENEIFPYDNGEDVRYEFSSPGEKEICLIAYNERGCSDTLCKWLEIVTDIWIPNVVTANGDDFNDRFKILIKGHTYYDLTIYNRWGERVFESDRFDYLWNGDVYNQYGPCPASTYYFIFRYQLIGGEIKKVNGSITLIR